MLRSHSQDRRRLPEDATAQITFYNQIQREAKAIFSVLQEAILPSACCEIPHEASLQLDMRQSHMHRDVHSRFKLCFSFEHAMVCDLELEVMVVKERIASRLESYTYYSRYVPKIAVTRCEGTTADARPLYSPALDRSSSICRICAESNNAVITCLCTGIKRAKGQKVCIGVLASEANGTFRICPQHPGLHLRPKDIISLGGLLAQWKPGPFMKDRLKLTLQLATAVLQLYDTCWLDYLWSSKDILFERDKSGHPVLSRPYVQKTFNGYSPALTPNTKDDLSAKKIARMCKKMLRSLGIVLLEIYHWKCIADLQSQLPKEGDETDEDPVSNLAADIVNIAGKTYGSVVEGCVYGWGRAKALADEEFKVEVYQKIVAPLEEHLKYFCGVKDLQKVFS
ncbi:hypothetical protein BDZ91DRAFT_507854 [Kalaharituber pfeilii]|nr:hypothetical protein BDZ91DRAFT_507854 [Kalaharituber pfeilii]